MINIFNELFNELTNTLHSYDNKIATSSVYVNIPQSYPTVSLEEIDSADYTLGSNCQVENYNMNEYEVNIYTKSPLAKSKADEILNVIDNLFHDYGFIRESKNPIPTNDETIYRIVVRYGCIVSQNKVIFRR